MSDVNPYQQPQSEVAAQVPPSDVAIVAPKKVSVGQAVGWLGDGLKMLSGNWGVVLGALVVTFLIAIVLQIIPFLGPIAQFFIMPLLYGGIVAIFRRIDVSGNSEFADLFAGFSNQTGPLILMALAQLGVFIVLGAVFALLFAMIGGFSSFDPNNPSLHMSGGMALIGLVFFVAIILISMLFYFAVPLIYLGKQNVLEAMKNSLSACLRNFFPLLIYGIVASIIAILACIPFGLGLLFVMPILAAAYYVSFKQILMDA
ncbi:ParB-like partition protein [Alcanivorax hongdengensis A-11-3]|uniref:ParB-like partition protein n=1 Tax=Alcanivorax hongdengensis A-11-3 TaxID=1177179 RepID=L0WB19_9GAMM|nr:BPSS1780 family membrane protein [Alcanivorax hongdengensis]EKF74171.1 ParB-like partition protein [Alcanivorax hongdengensis A-11-3]